MHDYEFSGPQLVVRHTGQRFSLTEGPVTIGREEDNRIVLDDGRASRHHAAIEGRGGALVIQDMHSANGTFVNGRRVDGSQVLRQGDAITIGDTILDVLLVPGRVSAATIQGALPDAPGVYAASRPGDETQQVAGGWQASRRASRRPAVLTGLLVLAVVALAAVLAFVLLRQDGAAPVTVVLDSPANGSQVSAGSQVPLEARASGEAITSLELLVDGALVATASSPAVEGSESLMVSTPWTFRAGTHIISARAHTAGGEVTEPVAASLLVVDRASQVTPKAPPSATEAPAPTATATAPEATATEPLPTPEPTTAEPTAAPPTSTPSLTPPPPTSTPSLTPRPPTSTPGSVSQPGVVTGFEPFGTWRRGEQANGTFTQSSEQVHDGTAAGKLAYAFPSGANDFVVFLQTFALAGRPNVISGWVYGDGSKHYLNIWILDAAGETWQFSLGRVSHSGWQQMVARLQPGDPWPAGHIEGPSNGVLDYPISFRGLALDDAPDSFSGSGTIYLDTLRYEESSAPPPPTATRTPAPNAATAPVLQFWADDTTISAGEATVLRWHVENVTAIYLEGEPVTGPDGSRRVRPSSTTTYRLRVVYPGGEQVLRVTIEVG